MCAIEGLPYTLPLYQSQARKNYLFVYYTFLQGFPLSHQNNTSRSLFYIVYMNIWQLLVFFRYCAMACPKCMSGKRGVAFGEEGGRG